jgi:PKD repeat protein
LRGLGITDSGPHTIWVTVTTRLGDELYTDTAATTVAVQNTSPTLALNGNAAVEAGAVYTLNLAAADPGDDTVHTWVVNWGDGSPAETYGGAAPTLTHAYAAPGNHVISVMAMDEDGGPYGPLTKSVSVAASRNITGQETGEEGAPFTLSLNNPAFAFIQSWMINWGDGTIETIPVPKTIISTFPLIEILLPRPLQNVSHTYAEDGAYRITVSTVDAGGATRTNIAPLDVRIENVAPSITSSQAPATVDQGAAWTLDVTAADPGVEDVLAYEFDLDGDGLFETARSMGQVTHAFGVPGQHTVRVRVRDDEGGVSDSSELTVIVDNVGPQLHALTVLTDSPLEGTPVHVQAVASDPGGVDDPLTYSFDFDDDGVFEVVTRSSVARHKYLDDGVYLVRARATDSHGDSAETTAQVVVGNLPPAMTPPFTSQPVEEGRPFQLTVRATDPAGVHDPLAYEFDFDGDGVYEAASATGIVTHTFADDSFPPPAGDGVYTVGIRVSDGDGGVTETTLDIQAHNVAPVIDVSGAPQIEEGEVYTLTLGDVVDPGDDTVAQYIVRWGDGTENVYTSGGPVTHVYRNTVGRKTIRVLLVDEDGVHPLAGQHAVLVTGAAIVDRTLFLFGSDDDDHVTIHKVGHSRLRVHATFFPGGPGREHLDYELALFDRVVMYLSGGADHATVAGNVDLPFIIDGGEGNDHLNGGAGPSVILGSGGDDMLSGGSRRDVLIGGTGADRLIGKQDADVLIAGRTVYDDDFLSWRALDAILAEWSSGRPVAERAANIRAGAGPFLAASGARFAVGETVFDDDSSDRVTADELDWLFANLSQDQISGRHPGLLDQI